MNNQTNLKFADLVEAYLSSPDWNKLSENSKRTYLSYVRKFVEKSGDRCLSLELTAVANGMQLPVAVAQDVAYWASLLEMFNGTQAKRMARRVLLVLLGWGRRYGFASFSHNVEIPSPRLTPKDKLPLTKEECDKLLELLDMDSFPDRFKPYIQAAIIAFHTGMRPSEIGNLSWSDVGKDFIQVRSAKARESGAVARLCKLTDGANKALPVRADGLVFKSVNGKPLNKDTRSIAFHTACKTLGIPERDFYSTRRGTATEMHNEGYDVAHIKGQLGHKNIATTMIYIQPTMKQAASQFRGF